MRGRCRSMRLGQAGRAGMAIFTSTSISYLQYGPLFFLHDRYRSMRLGQDGRPNTAFFTKTTDPDIVRVYDEVMQALNQKVRPSLGDPRARYALSTRAGMRAGGQVTALPGHGLRSPAPFQEQAQRCMYPYGTSGALFSAYLCSYAQSSKDVLGLSGPVQGCLPSSAKVCHRRCDRLCLAGHPMGCVCASVHTRLCMQAQQKEAQQKENTVAVRAHCVVPWTVPDGHAQAHHVLRPHGLCLCCAHSMWPT